MLKRKKKFETDVTIVQAQLSCRQRGAEPFANISKFSVMNSAHNAPRNSYDLTPQLWPALAIERRDQALRPVFEKKYEFYVALAYSILRTMEDAKDIVGEVFHGALNDWESRNYEDIENLEAFLTTCVKNACKNWIKRQDLWREITKVFLFNATSTDNPMVNIDLDIQSLLNQLPPKQGEAFGLFLEGYSHEEIAEKLECSEGASRTLLYNARKKLRKLLGTIPYLDPDDDDPNANSKRTSQLKEGKAYLHLNQSGATPKLVDILNYLSNRPTATGAKNRIIHWFVEEESAHDTLVGFRIALHKFGAKALETQLAESKDKLRTQLFGRKPRRFTADTPSNKPCRNVPVGFEYRNTSISDGNISGQFGCYLSLSTPSDFTIEYKHRENRKTNENSIINHKRLIFPIPKNKTIMMEFSIFIVDKFRDFVLDSDHDHCENHGLSDNNVLFFPKEKKIKKE